MKTKDEIINKLNLLKDERDKLRMVQKLDIKGFKVRIEFNQEPLLSWYCGYVEFDRDKTKNFYSNQTYRAVKGNKVEIGVDTAHSYNKKMLINEKFDDCVRQITEVIDEYLKDNK